MIELYEFVSDEQFFKASVVSVSNVYSKIFKKKNICSAKWILHRDLTFPDKAVFSQKTKNSFNVHIYKILPHILKYVTENT